MLENIWEEMQIIIQTRQLEGGKSGEQPRTINKHLLF